MKGKRCPSKRIKIARLIRAMVTVTRTSTASTASVEVK